MSEDTIPSRVRRTDGWTCRMSTIAIAALCLHSAMLMCCKNWSTCAKVTVFRFSEYCMRGCFYGIETTVT